MSLGGGGGCSGTCSLEIYFNIVQFGAFCGLCFVTMMITAYSFEKMLSENANFMININVNNCVFSTDGVDWLALHLKFGSVYI